MIVVFDDDAVIRKSYGETLRKMGLNIQVIECSTKQEVRAVLKNQQIMNTVKVLIFDLSVTNEEAEALKFDILDDIKENYKKYPIPIFIHSAFAHTVEGYDDLGTLFKIDKSSTSLEVILNKIALFDESGFLDIFCPGGSIEKEIYIQIHQAFIEQFKGDEISLIIESIKNSGEDNFKRRTKDVFERMAVRSLFQNLLAARKSSDSTKIEEIKINAIEHYYRRSSDFPIWTGDIFRNKEDKSEILIITPRCDINNGYCNGNYLCCSIESLEEKKVKDFSKDTKAVHNYLNDNPQNTGIKYRYLLPTPSYSGGKINLTNYFLINDSNLINKDSKYEYLISLSDELTNDVIRKYASYLLRSGISQSDLDEASFYSKVEAQKRPSVA
ncbi:hypothetical protein [Mucilaginibacter sp.]|uniref:hypothetical protein n=1 Tax=Mucilaginibacter sp. TaxID=1882438 RepID=UPI0035BC5C83